MAEQDWTSPDDVQFRFRDDEVISVPAVTVDSFKDQTNASAVRIEPGDDARQEQTGGNQAVCPYKPVTRPKMAAESIAAEIKSDNEQDRKEE